MSPRPRRPAPRTLSATPPTPLRAPHATGYEARFPALAVVLAGGAVLPACEPAVCGATRADELETHGREGYRAAGNGQASEALRELGVALGVVKHRATTVPDITTAGAPPPVDPTPPQQVTPPPHVAPPELPLAPSGGVAPVSPQPPSPPPRRNTTRPRNPQPVNPPQVDHPRTAGAPPRVAPTPTPSGARRGDIASVGALPVAAPSRRT